MGKLPFQSFCPVFMGVGLVANDQFCWSNFVVKIGKCCAYHFILSFCVVFCRPFCIHFDPQYMCLNMIYIVCIYLKYLGRTRHGRGGIILKKEFNRFQLSWGRYEIFFSWCLFKVDIFGFSILFYVCLSFWTNTPLFLEM